MDDDEMEGLVDMIAIHMFDDTNDALEWNSVSESVREHWRHEAREALENYYFVQNIAHDMGWDEFTTFDDVNKIIYKSLNKYDVSDDIQGYLTEVAVMSEELGEISRAIIDQRDCWLSEMREETFDLMVASMKFAMHLSDYDTKEFMRRFIRSLDKLK